MVSLGYGDWQLPKHQSLQKSNLSDAALPEKDFKRNLKLSHATVKPQIIISLLIYACVNKDLFKLYGKNLGRILRLSICCSDVGIKVVLNPPNLKFMAHLLRNKVMGTLRLSASVATPGKVALLKNCSL